MWVVLVFVLAMKVGSMLDVSTYIGRPVHAPGADPVAERLKDCPWGNMVLVDEHGFSCMDHAKHSWSNIYPQPLTCGEDKLTDVTCVPGERRYDEGGGHGHGR